MNRDFYTFGKTFLGLTALAAIVNGIIFLTIGNEILTWNSFLSWSAITLLSNLVASLLMLKYFRIKGYRAAHITLIVIIVFGMAQAIVFFVLIFTKQLVGLYSVLLVINVILGTIYGGILWLSRTGERIHLRWAGTVGVLTGIPLLIFLFLILNEKDAAVQRSLDHTAKWIVLIAASIPILMLLNFNAEQKEVSGDEIVLSKASMDGLGFAGMLCVLLSIGFCFWLTMDSLNSVKWKKINAERTQGVLRQGEERVYSSGVGQELRYVLIKPKNYSDTIQYPLLVNLPYGGYEGATFAEMLMDPARREKYPAFILIPFRPDNASWGGVPNLPSIDSLVFGAIESVGREYSIDKKRQYVAGISMGAYGSWNFVCRRPDLFAATIPVCGSGDPSLAARLEDVDVWAFHGKNDRNVPVEGSRNMIEAIKKTGVEPRYTEYPHLEHNIWHEVSATPELLSWLFEQHKN